MEYRLGRSQIAPEVVFAARESGIPHSRPRTHTPIVDLNASSTGPTPEQLRRFAAGESVSLVVAGRYRLESLLGRGGMGSVFLAHDLELDRAVALKTLDIDRHDCRWAIARFMHEAELATRVRHRNIVDVHEFGTTPEGVVYMAMERLVGRKLETIVARRRLSWRWARYLLVQACAGVNAIHAAGVVHRDLKASNCIYVERSATVKIFDFGAATDAARDEDDTPVIGTPEYMAPEQIRGGLADERTDVYALGVLLCKLITGRTPFRCPTVEQVFDQQLHAQPPPLHQLATGLEYPRVIDDIVARALAKRPRDRYASAQALADALCGVDEDPPARCLISKRRLAA